MDCRRIERSEECSVAQWFSGVGEKYPFDDHCLDNAGPSSPRRIFFFFDRDIPERNASTLIRTLAYQLALFDVSIGAEMSRITESIPRITEMPLDFQFTNLLSAQALKLVEWSGGPVVVVIDALDECGNETERKVLMQALSKGFSNLPSFMRVIVVSRPETDIEDMLSSHEAVHPYSLDIDSAATQEDISEFLRHWFSDIRRMMRHSRLGVDWR